MSNLEASSQSLDRCKKVFSDMCVVGRYHLDEGGSQNYIKKDCTCVID